MNSDIEGRPNPDSTNSNNSISDMISWKSYVDRVFEEHRTQVEDALAAHDRFCSDEP